VHDAADGEVGCAALQQGKQDYLGYPPS